MKVDVPKPELLSDTFPGETEENHETSLSEQPVTTPRQLVTSRLRHEERRRANLCKTASIVIVNWSNEYRQNVKSSEEVALSHASDQTPSFYYYSRQFRPSSLGMVYDTLVTTP
jgi:hypothetical protein